MHSTESQYISLDKSSKLERKVRLLSLLTFRKKKDKGLKFNSVKVMEFPKTWSDYHVWQLSKYKKRKVFRLHIKT